MMIVKNSSENRSIVVRDVSFWYGEKRILDALNTEFPDRQITSLIGPSGCGKSTFIRCLNRMNDLYPQARHEGKALFSGENILSKNIDVVELRKKIGMVFQKPNPFPMSIYDNVAYGLRVQNGRSASEIKSIVEESLKKADLWSEVHDRLDASAFRLSGGQQQRLCIARALAVNPEVLLLDEPCSALDPIATAKIEKLLLKLKKEVNIIIVTHNMHQARRISDNTIYLLSGRIIEQGKTKKIFSNPEQKLTKEYINGEFG